MLDNGIYIAEWVLKRDRAKVEKRTEIVSNCIKRIKDELDAKNSNDQPSTRTPSSRKSSYRPQ